MAAAGGSHFQVNSMIDGSLPVDDSWDFNKVDPLEDLRNDKDRLTLIAAPVPPVEVDVAVRATEWNGA